MTTTRPWPRVAVALAAAVCVGAPGARAQEPEAPAPPPPARLERLLPAATQVAVLVEEPATLLKQLEEKTTAEIALRALGASAGEDEGFRGFGGRTPLQLLAQTAQTLLGTAGGRETLERLPYPVALAITGFVVQPFDFAGEGLARADLLLVIETRDADAAAKLAREMGERCERAGIAAREAEFRDVAIRCFDERVTVPKGRRFRFPHQAPGDEAPPGGGGDGGAGPADPVAQDEEGEGDAATRVVTRAICHCGTLCAVAPSEEAARQWIQRAKDDESADRLADQAEWTRGMAPLPVGAAVRFFANLDRLRPEAKEGQRDPFGGMFGGGIGKGLASRALGFRLRDDGYTIDEYTAVAGDADPQALGPIVLLAPATADPLPEPVMVPDGVEEVSVLRVSWKEFWGFWEGIARLQGQDLDAAAEAEGLHPYRDFMSALGDIVVRWQRTAMRRVPADEGEGEMEVEDRVSAACLAVKEEARLLATLGKHADRPQGGIERKEFDGRAIFVDKSGGGLGMLGMFGGGGPGSAVCVTGGYFVQAAGGEEEVRATVARLKSEGSPFFADEAWKALRAHLPERLSACNYARRAKDRLAIEEGVPMVGDLQMYGLSLKFGDELAGEHCDRAVQGIARAPEGLRAVTATRWAPKAK